MYIRKFLWVHFFSLLKLVHTSCDAYFLFCFIWGLFACLLLFVFGVVFFLSGSKIQKTRMKQKMSSQNIFPLNYVKWPEIWWLGQEYNRIHISAMFVLSKSADIMSCFNTVFWIFAWLSLFLPIEFHSGWQELKPVTAGHFLINSFGKSHRSVPFHTENRISISCNSKRLILWRRGRLLNHDKFLC